MKDEAQATLQQHEGHAGDRHTSSHYSARSEPVLSSPATRNVARVMEGIHAGLTAGSSTSSHPDSSLRAPNQCPPLPPMLPLQGPQPFPVPYFPLHVSHSIFNPTRCGLLQVTVPAQKSLTAPNSAKKKSQTPLRSTQGHARLKSSAQQADPSVPNSPHGSDDRENTSL